jgi:hypothetical protein
MAKIAGLDVSAVARHYREPVSANRLSMSSDAFENRYRGYSCLTVCVVTGFVNRQRGQSEVAWCREGDSNPHALYGQQILRLQCLPFHHPGADTRRKNDTRRTGRV